MCQGLQELTGHAGRAEYLRRGVGDFAEWLVTIGLECVRTCVPDGQGPRRRASACRCGDLFRFRRASPDSETQSLSGFIYRGALGI
jgi:hypothetical protein